MLTMPSPQILASLVSTVTETMFGMSFAIAKDDAQPWGNAPAWRTVVLPIPGRHPIQVAIASNDAGAAVLGGAMFSCELAAVDDSMKDDSLSELANIVAGQIKSVLGLDQALGLPKLVPAESMSSHAWHGATLNTSTQQAQVWVAITEN